MSDDELDTIDGRLGVTMPAQYRQFMLDQRASLPALKRMVYDESRNVVNQTMHLRMSGLGEDTISSDLVVIGDNGFGDFFFLDLAQEPATVVEYDHERGKFKSVAFSFTSWVITLAKAG